MDSDFSRLLNVRETARLLDIHENTVRNWVRDGTLTDARLPGARFHRFERAEVERLIADRSRKSVQSLQGERRTIGPELVDASQINAWASTASRRAQDTFPELMRRLLAATPAITAIVVRSGDGVAFPGWDGSATSKGAPFLPAGELRFEFGVSRNVKKKADEDWASRTADGALPTETFIFATPRRWRDGPAWQKAHAEMGLFADVKVIDADVIEGWLQTTPAAHYWLSEEMGRQPRDAATIEEWWRRFASGATIDLPVDLFMAGRAEQRDKLLAFLRRDPRVTTIQSEWTEDAKAFIYAATRTEDEPSPPIVVVSSPEVWARVVEQPGRIILIPDFEKPAVGTAVNQGHHVLIVVDRLVDSGRAVDIELPRLERIAAAGAFQKMGIAFTRAQRYAVAARRNPQSFMRSLSPDPRFAHPEWAQHPAARILAPLMLIGSWTTEPDDLEVVTRLVGLPWSEIEATAKAVSVPTNDPVFRQIGTQWGLTSPVEAFLLLAPSLNSDDVQRWSSELQHVLLDPDPTLDLPLDERPFAAIHGVRRPYSATLRAGLTQSLALMGTYGERQTPDGTNSLVDAASEVVRTVLAAASADPTGHLWHQISGNLQLMAEAAPQEFLDSIEDDLSSSDPVVVRLFQDNVQGRFQIGPSSPHPNLLWALETITWSVEYFLDGIRVLARLAALDPGGKTGNRPAASLSSILTGWIRHTSAPLTERERALEVVVGRDAQVGWELVLALWPTDHAFVMPPSAPHYRDWQPNTSSVPMSEWVSFVHVIVARAIVLAGLDPVRLGKLADGISTVPAVDQEAIMERLETVAGSGALSDDDRLALWEELRKLMAHHQRFSTAAWAMPAAQLDRLAKIVAVLEPEADPNRFGYLFDWHPDLPKVDQTDFEAYQARLRELQQAAIEDIVRQPDFLQKLTELAPKVRVPMHLGWALAERDEATLADVQAWLTAEPGPLRDAAAGWVQSKLRLRGPAWLAETLEALSGDDAARQFVLLQVGPSGDLWRVIESSETDFDFYWRNARVEVVQAAEDVDEAVLELVGHDRSWAAITVLSYGLRTGTTDEGPQPFTSETVTAVLSSAISEEADPRDVSNMTGFYIGQLLDYLSSVGTELGVLARLEFAFFRLLEHTREPRALKRALAEDADLFVDLVKRVYRGKSQQAAESTEAERQNATHAWWVLNGWTGFPGQRDDGTLDADAMNAWVTSARLALSEDDRADVGDEVIGEALAHSPAEDGVWPSVPVRDMIERIGSKELENGLAIGKRKSRGVTTRGVYDGGQQERALESQYREWSKATRGTWRRTSRMLRELADSYERDARRQDIEAEIDADRE